MKLLLALTLALYAFAARTEEPVDLELVLLADSTGSIDDAEIMFQRRGYAAAITHPQVLDAIAGTGRGRIAVVYVEWGDSLAQHVVADWHIVDGSESAAAFAAALLAPPRRTWGRNAIGSALLFGKRLIEENDFAGMRRVIDFSADSANNWTGPPIDAAVREVVGAGIVINGLAVLCRACNGRPVDYDLERAFEETIIGGPGAFVITADSAATFEAAVRRKLILEISGLQPAIIRAEMTLPK